LESARSVMYMVKLVGEHEQTHLSFRKHEHRAASSYQ
jgi:hypothetical protein